MKFSSLIEIILIFIVLVVFNYISDANNLFYINNILNIYLYALTIIALFYGLIYALLFYILYFTAIYFYYHKFYIEAISYYFIFLTIFSEFMYYWNKKINKLKEENSYLKKRIEELGSAYYLLKISHDELEQHYILKPFSIREILREIRDLAYDNQEKSINLFMQLLKKLFHIEKAGLYLKEKGKFVLKDYLGEKIKLNTEDPLIKKALDYQTMAYIAHIHNKKSDLLAAIPILSLDHKLYGIFIIKEIPFFSLTKDNLITIELFLTYFINLTETIEKYKKYKNPFLIKEIFTLSNLSKKFKMKNFIVIFYINDELEIKSIEKKLRGIDIAYPYNNKLIVILPLTPLSGTMKFCEKIKESVNVEYKIFDLSKFSLEKIEKILND